MSQISPNWAEFSNETLITEIQNLWSVHQKKILFQAELSRGLQLLDKFRPQFAEENDAAVVAAVDGQIKYDELLRRIGLHSLWVHTEGQRGKRLCLTNEPLEPFLNFRGLWLMRSDLRNTQLAHRDLSEVNFIRSELAGACLEGSNLSYSTLVLADMQSTLAKHANFAYANLGMANLRGANLSGACLVGANLQYASLEGANLTGADLRASFLLDAHLEGADLRGVLWDGADLTGAFFKDAMVDRDIDPKKTILHQVRDLKGQVVSSSTSLDKSEPHPLSNEL